MIFILFTPEIRFAYIRKKTDIVRIFEENGNLFRKYITAILIFTIFSYSSKSQNCPGSPLIEVDLSESLNEVFHSGSITPSNSCCEFPASYSCIELMITVHPEATQVTIAFSQSSGSFYYTLNCSSQFPIPSNRILSVCVDDPGPHSIVFCHPGGNALSFVATTQDTPFEVTLSPFEPICQGSDAFPLTGGFPTGGNYFINDIPNVTGFVFPWLLNIGDNEIRYEYTNPQTGCHGIAVQNLEVIELPQIEWTGMDLCKYEGWVELFGATPEGGIYTGDFVSGNHFHVGIAPPGDYVITYSYTDPYGCFSSAVDTVTVHELPIADAGGDLQILAGNSANLNAADGGGTGTYSYQWAPASLFVNPNLQNATTVNLTQSQIFTLTVTDLTTGCINTDEVIVIVTGTDLEIVDIDASPDNICMGESSQLWALPSGGSGNYTYNWTPVPDDPSLVDNTIASPTVSPTTTTTYTLTLGDVNVPGITAQSSITVNVTPLPNVSLVIDPPWVCANTPGYSLTGGLPADGSYMFMDLDTNLLSLPYIDFSNFFPQDIGEGNYLVQYEYTDPLSGCTNYAIQPFEILPFVKAQFFVHQPDMCNTGLVNIANHSQGATDTPAYVWNYGDGFSNNEDADNFQYIYPDSLANYTITLTASGSGGLCTHQRQRNVQVYPSVTAEFEIVGADTGCSPHNVSFNNLSEGNILLYFWDFGDGTFSVEPHPSHTYINHSDQDTTFIVRLTTVSTTYFCVEIFELPVTVHPYIEAGFTVTPVEGCHPLEVIIGNASTGALNYSWDFGNGINSTDEDPVNQIYENLTDSVIEYQITQHINNNSCSDSISHTVQVFPAIFADIEVSDTIGCSPLVVDFENKSSNSATHFSWDFGDGGSSSLENPTHIFENNSDADTTFTVWFRTRTDYFCKDSMSIEITVHPRIKADFDFNPAEACNPHEVTIFNTSHGVLNYNWDFGDGTMSNTSDSSFTHYFEHDDPDPVTYEIYLEVINAQGCMDSLMRPITIFPKITADFTMTDTIGCSPLMVQFTNSSIGVDNYLWEFGDGGSSVEESPVHIFENNSWDTVAVFDVHLFNESPYLCTADTTVQITVYPRVRADFTIAENQGCSPFIVVIENHSMGAAQLEWDFGGLDNSTTDNTVDFLTYTFENTTNDIITYDIELLAINSFGCTDTIIRTITVFPEVDIDYTHVTEGCHPLPVFFDNQTQNASYYSWDFGDGIVNTDQSPSHVFHNFSHTLDTIFYVELFALSQHGCFATDTSEVHVYPKPDASFVIENSPGCSPHEIIISHNSEGASEFYWDFGDGSGTFNYDDPEVTHFYNHEPGSGVGYFDIELMVENTPFGCSDTLVHQAVIYPNITAEFSSNVVEGCHPLTVDFTNLSEGATAMSAYLWDYGNGNTSNDSLPVHTHTFHNFSHTQDTTYQVMLVAYNENACSDTAYVEITVHPRPMAFFSVPNVPACAPHDVNVHNFSVGDIGNDEISYLWDMGDGDTLYHSGTHFTHGYTQPPGAGPGIFTITLEVENVYQCSHSYSQQIIIYPEIIADFTTDNEGCHAHTTTFVNLTQGGDLYHWDFGNGNSSQSIHPNETFLNYSHTESEVFVVTLYSESHYGCTSQVTDSIIVRPLPKAEFDLAELAGCSPFTTEVENISIGDNDYTWSMGDGNDGAMEDSFSYTWNNTNDTPQTFLISLEAINQYGCEASSSQSITVFPEVTAAFASEGDIWEGCSPLTVRFLNESHLADSYFWNFSDGETSTSANPQHTFYNDEVDPFIHTAELTATSIYGCTDTVSHNVTVYPAPVAKFTALPKKQTYPDATITLTNHTNPGYWDFIWEFGDGNNLNTVSFDPFTHTYIWDPNDMSTKTYVVALFASNEYCDDMYTQEVTITSPVPQADLSSELAGCEPFTVQFYNNSLYAHSFRWDFDDGGVSSHPEPEHTFMDHGLYNVMMIAIGDGGRDTIYHLIEVHQNPTADFELVSPHIHIPSEPLEVINQSELADFYWWDFGDGGTSNVFEPIYYYREAGIYDITLIVTRDTYPQCHDTLTLNNVLRVDENCRIIFPNAFMPDINGPSGGHFDLSNPSTQIFHPVYEGIQEYALEIYNRWGEFIYRSDDINIGWDGYVNGKLSKMDVYVWKVTGRCTNGKKINMAGDVTLYR